MLSVLVNVLAVVAGSLIGLLLGKGVKKDAQAMVMTAAGMFTLFIGLRMAWKSERELYVIIALILGGGLGTWLGIEDRILGLGERIRARLPAGKALPGSEKHPTFAEGFLTASVLYCVGAMAIIGSFEAGTLGDNKIIYIKSVLDGFLSIILAGRFGLGVLFSFIPVALYQGALVLLSSWIAPWVGPLALTEISGAGGVMVMMIGFNLLEIKKIKTGNYLPAMIIVWALTLADPWLKRFVV